MYCFALSFTVPICQCNLSFERGKKSIVVTYSFLHVYMMFRYAIIYEKGYQTTEEVVSAVTTKVVGIGYTNGTGIYENAGDRVWDSSDYVVPPQVCWWIT